MQDDFAYFINNMSSKWKLSATFFLNAYGDYRLVNGQRSFNQIHMTSVIERILSHYSRVGQIVFGLTDKKLTNAH